MALSNDPVFAQTPKTAGISFGAGTQSTAMDPATVAPTVLLTAGADGALVTSIQAFAEVTVTANSNRMLMRNRRAKYDAFMVSPPGLCISTP